MYEAETMLMVSSVDAVQTNSTNKGSIDGLVDALSQYPRITVDTYKEQVKAYDVLSYVREEAGLQYMNLSSLANKINVQAIDKTNLIKISVKDNNPEQAARLANMVSNRFTGFVSETNSRQAEASAEFIKNELENERVNLEAAHNSLKDFLSQPRGPQELKLELDSKLSQLTGYKTKVSNLEINDSIYTDKLAKANELLSVTPEFIEVDKTLSSDQLMLGVYSDSAGVSSSSAASLILKDKLPNIVYTDLVGIINNLELSITQTRSEIEITLDIIEIRQKEIEAIQSELAVKQQTYDELTHQYSLSKQTYDAFQQQYKEATIRHAAEIGKQSVIVISQAVAPESPVSPNKKLNLAIGLMLGLMLGAFTAFLKEYWCSEVKGVPVMS